MIIHSFGAAGQVTGSCHLVRSTQTFLFDCGLFQGTKEVDAQNTQDLPFDPSELDFVLLSHAHLDHCGRLPLLTQKGFSGPIYTSQASRDIVELMLRDSAKIQQMQKHPLYSEEDVDNTLSLLYPIEEGSKKTHGQTSFSFYPAGHFLGAHWIKVKTPEATIAFSGDLGRYDCPFYPQPYKLGRVDILLLEGTIGSRVHPPIKEGLNRLYKEVKKCIQKKETVLIPAFSIGRTEEILSTLVKLALEEENHSFFDIPIYVDSKLARNGLTLFHKYDNLHKMSLEHLAPDNLYLRDLKETASLKIEGPKILISASGMMEGGPIMVHAKKYLPDKETTVFIVGYQGEETLGRQILTGQKEVTILEADLEVQAKIIEIKGLSGHGDSKDLQRFVSSAQGLKTILLVHGEASSLQDLKEVFDKDYTVHIQKHNQPFEM
ncbi:MAG TPA: MBL fold metallo-hydrolase [Clostridia bacterium]|nr:MBL fold metallo-hydrolase [Clostridia bacterium]